MTTTTAILTVSTKINIILQYQQSYSNFLLLTFQTRLPFTTSYQIIKNQRSLPPSILNKEMKEFEEQFSQTVCWGSPREQGAPSVCRAWTGGNGLQEQTSLGLPLMCGCCDKDLLPTPKPHSTKPHTST